MAMPMGNAVAPEIMHFPAVVTGGEMQYRPQQQQQWFVDERDEFMIWLRSEFAAANAIIDCLCHHLCVVDEGSEYDVVIGAIQQRRCNWNQVLLMQQYYSVSEVSYALQQVAWRRQQRVVKPVVKEFRKVRQWQRFEGANVKEGCNSSVELNGNKANLSVKETPVIDKIGELKSEGKVGTKDDKSSDIGEEKTDTITNHQSGNILKRSGNSQGSLSSSECEAVGVNEGITSNSRENDSHSMQNQNQKENNSTMGKAFIGNEIVDGKMVNVVDGLKLHEDLFDSTEVSKLVSLVNDMRIAGKKGQFQGNQTYVVSKRPMRGHGREMIQLGLPIVDAPQDVDNMTASTKGKKIEPIPSLFQDIIERMATSQVMTVKPDACIVDFYNEGDHLTPNSWPSWFGRPVYMLFLTECDMTFGTTIVSDNPGDYRGTLKLSLVPGSLLVMQGKSTDCAKYAIPSIPKQRILVTFAKSQPKKSLPIDAQRLASPATSHSSAASSRNPNHHKLVPKHYSTVQVTGILPAPSLRAPPNSMQPLFVPALVAPPMQLSTPMLIPPGSTGWTMAPPRHPPPRVPGPGTGVFLPPPGSANSSLHLQGTLTNVGTLTTPIKENRKSNHSNTSGSPKGKMDGNMQRLECNGNADGTEVEKAIEEEGVSNGETVASH